MIMNDTIVDKKNNLDPSLVSNNLDSAEKTINDVKVQDEKESSIRTIKSKNSNTNNKGIYYTKTKEITLPVTRLSFSNIPVYQGVQVSFYEKYVILLLQKGIKAIDRKELVEKISSILNVSRKCIDEFVDYLSLNGFLQYNSNEPLFYLSVNYSIDKTLKNAMFAEFDEKMADCNKVLFSETANCFFLEDDFANDSFKRTTSSLADNSSYLLAKVIDLAESSKDSLRDIFARSFAQKNMHLTNNFSYQLNDSKFTGYEICFDAIIEYKYSPDTNESIKQSVIVRNDNLLSDEVINTLSDIYNKDDDIPRFISLEKELYNRINSSSEEIESIETNIESAQKDISPIQDEIDAKKKSLDSAKKEYKEKEEKEKVKAAEIQEKLDATDKDIKINEDLVNLNKGTNKDLVKNLQKAIAELEKSKTDLQKQLNEQNSTIENMAKSFRQQEEQLNSTIISKENEIKKIKSEITGYEENQKRIVKEYNQAISENKKSINPVIASVLSKYPKDSNILFGYISDISLGLDRAISAAENNSFNEVGRSIDMIREMYRKTLQAVFDGLLKNTAENLASYLSDPFNVSKVDQLFRKRNIALDVKNKLIIFHGLANAIGHSVENGPQKSSNEKRVKDFKELSDTDRTKILLSIPNFFNSITFTKTEINAIVSKLKI